MKEQQETEFNINNKDMKLTIHQL